MDWIVKTLQHYPELAIFLTLALGYWIGKFKIGKFSLGSVTGVLLSGVLVGQMRIIISPNVKSVFILMFLFSVGYGLGPQFFRGLKSDGLPQVLFAILVCLACLGTAYGAAKIVGFNTGLAAGLLSGSCTISAVIGVATDAINQLSIPAAQKTIYVNQIAIADAVTYIFGTAGTAWFLSSLGPKLLKINLPEECRKLENKMGGGEAEPGVISAYHRFDVRAHKLTNAKCAGQTVAEIEESFQPRRVFVERIRRGAAIIEAEPETALQEDDVLAVLGPRDVEIGLSEKLGPEVDDPGLLDFPAEMLDVVITNKSVAGKTLQEIAQSTAALVQGRGVVLRKLIRQGHEMPFTPGTTIDRGDVLQIGGAQRVVERAVQALGYADRPTNITDMTFVGMGIVLGGLIGALTLRVGGIPLSLSTSGGALIAGLVFGWLRSVHRTFGR
ncbi:MAG: aspartate-alanine antiporter, partial [Candidatus Aureabacteria bacterium]|nr:aspartate-alanine antiporter [Candidatus Auribacterota bacterium]